MVEIKANVVINSTSEKIWEVISDVDNEPKFWKGTKSIRNISKDKNSVIREITIAFKDKKCMQTVILHPKEKIVAQFTEGIIKGEKIIRLDQTSEGFKLEAVWNIKFSGMMGMFTGMIKKHIQSGTEQALESIKKEVEN